MTVESNYVITIATLSDCLKSRPSGRGREKNEHCALFWRRIVWDKKLIVRVIVWECAILRRTKYFVSLLKVSVTYFVTPLYTNTVRMAFSTDESSVVCSESNRCVKRKQFVS